MWRGVILLIGLIACAIATGVLAQDERKTVIVEIYAPEGARLFIEGKELKL